MLADEWAEPDKYAPDPGELEEHCGHTADVAAVVFAIPETPEEHQLPPPSTVADLPPEIAESIAAMAPAPTPVPHFWPGTIVSGGQCGADRGGLDAAIALGIHHHGFCPQGRLAEDGRIPDRYTQQETGTANYGERTALNVKYSDATLLFAFGKPTGGSAFTSKLCKRWKKPCLGINLTRFDDKHVAGIRAWLDTRGREWIDRKERGLLRPDKVYVLNVAGSRESKAPGIQAIVRDILVAVFGGDKA